MLNTAETPQGDRMHITKSVWAWENRGFPCHLRFFPQTDRCCNLLPGKHVGIVFQRHKINNYSTSRTSRDRGRSLCARLLWEFSNSRAIYEVSHACCCGVCPFRSLSLSLPPSLLLLLPAASPFFSVFLTHPLSLRLPRPYTSSLLLLSRRIVGLWERKGYREYWSFGESLWKMAPVVTGWVWDSGLVVGERSWREYKLLPWNSLILVRVL